MRCRRRDLGQITRARHTAGPWIIGVGLDLVPLLMLLMLLLAFSEAREPY